MDEDLGGIAGGLWCGSSLGDNGRGGASIAVSKEAEERGGVGGGAIDSGA